MVKRKYPWGNVEGKKSKAGKRKLWGQTSEKGREGQSGSHFVTS